MLDSFVFNKANPLLQTLSDLRLQNQQLHAQAALCPIGKYAFKKNEVDYGVEIHKIVGLEPCGKKGTQSSPEVPKLTTIAKLAEKAVKCGRCKESISFGKIAKSDITEEHLGSKMFYKFDSDKMEDLCEGCGVIYCTSERLIGSQRKQKLV